MTNKWLLLMGAVLTASVLTVLKTTPATAIPPAPPPYQMVFFASDTAELTKQAKDTLRYKLPQMRLGVAPCQNLRAVGHLDRAETKRGRAGFLDLLRATRVRDYLREAGLTDLILDVLGAGGYSLLVPQAPDDEPQNRRVEIWWGCPVQRGVR